MPSVVKISTYNICKGKNHKIIVANVLSLAKAGSNVICLQELHKVHNRQFIGDEIKAALGGEWGAEYFMGSGRFNSGLAVFWKKPDFNGPAEFEKISLPAKNGNHLDKKPLVTRRGVVERRALVADFRTGDKLMRITNLHLDWWGGVERRLSQVRFVTDRLKAKPPADCEIICGDLNTIGSLSRSKLQRRRISELLGREFVSVLPDTSHTWHFSAADPAGKRTTLGSVLRNLGRAIRQRLDYVWVNGFDVLDSRVVYVGGSDHFPITATLRATLSRGEV